MTNERYSTALRIRNEINGRYEEHFLNRNYTFEISPAVAMMKRTRKYQYVEFVAIITDMSDAHKDAPTYRFPVSVRYNLLNAPYLSASIIQEAPDMFEGRADFGPYEGRAREKMKDIFISFSDDSPNLKEAKLMTIRY